jgi:hypothetical protein
MNKPDEDSHTKLQDDHETIDLYNFGKPGNIDTAHIPPRTTSLTSFATLEAEELQFTRWYRVRHILSKALFSRVYFVLYFIIIAISLFLLIWNLVNFWDHPKEIWYMILEGFINFSLVVDVIARMIVEGTTYFKKWFNYLDMFLTALCVVLFVIYCARISTGGCWTKFGRYHNFIEISSTNSTCNIIHSKPKQETQNCKRAS